MVAASKHTPSISVVCSPVHLALADTTWASLLESIMNKKCSMGFCTGARKKNYNENVPILISCHLYSDIELVICK